MFEDTKCVMKSRKFQIYHSTRIASNCQKMYLSNNVENVAFIRPTNDYHKHYQMYSSVPKTIAIIYITPKRYVRILKTSIDPPHYLEVPVPIPESEWSCICVF